METSNPLLLTILDLYPNEEFIIIDGFDDAIIGITFDEDFYRIVYSVPKIFDKLIGDGLLLDEAIEFFDFNIAGLKFGIKGPIYAHDPNYIPPYERYLLN
jgi:hypothetical protein